MYTPNAVSKYQTFVNDVNNALQSVESTESTNLFGDFNAHIGTDNETLKDVNGSSVDPEFNDNVRYLLHFVVATGSAL